MARAVASLVAVRVRQDTDPVTLVEGVLQTWRPYKESDLGKRIRIIWEGSEYRGRGRQSVWDGSAVLTGNSFGTPTPINLWNIDKTLQHPRPDTLSWSALTTGGFGGADVTLADAHAGTLSIKTAQLSAEVPVAEIGFEDKVFDTVGGIKRRMRLFRLPDRNETRSAKLSRRIKLNDGIDNAIYVCITLEDGSLIWSSPVYVFRG